MVRNCSGCLINRERFNRKESERFKTVVKRTDDYLENRVKEADELNSAFFLRMRDDDERFKMARASKMSHKLYVWGFEDE